MQALGARAPNVSLFFEPRTLIQLDSAFTYTVLPQHKDASNNDDLYKTIIPRRSSAFVYNYTPYPELSNYG